MRAMSARAGRFFAVFAAQNDTPASADYTSIPTARISASALLLVTTPCRIV